MESIIQNFFQLDNSTVSDALDKLGINSQCIGIKSIATSWKIAGRVYTVKYKPVESEKGTWETT